MAKKATANAKTTGKKPGPREGGEQLYKVLVGELKKKDVTHPGVRKLMEEADRSHIAHLRKFARSQPASGRRPCD